MKYSANCFWSVGLLVVLLWNPVSGQATMAGKEPLSEKARCQQECLRSSQMAAVGIEVLEQQCREICAVELAIKNMQSSSADVYAESVRVLAASDDPRVVHPLIEALERDLVERTGLWAEIIPALGRLGDSAALPILTKTLKISDDDWLGRGMSAKALGEIGTPCVVPVLLDAVWQSDIREEVIGALARIRDKRVVAPLLEALTPEEEKETRTLAIKGLERLGDTVLPEVLAAFDAFGPEHPETEKRVWLCKLLGRSRNPRAVNTLRTSRNDKDPAVAECARKLTDN